MASKRLAVVGVIAVLVGVGTYFYVRTPNSLTLTGIVTTDDIVVSPQVAGQISQLLVKEGDSVHQGQLLAVLSSGELAADRAFFARSEEGSAKQVQESEAALRYQEQQTADQIHQAEATLGSAIASRDEAVANVANTKTILDRDETMLRGGGISPQDADQARTAYTVAKSRADAIDKQIEAARAALSLAKSAAQQVAMRRSAFESSRAQHQAAVAQTAKADVRLAYAELHAPTNGVVDVRAARPGEVVSAGQPVLTLVNPDELWVRADVEESYIDRVRIGDSLSVRLPSGEIRRGVVFYRGLDAGFATQRDVSRTKRDIKTFEVRIRIDNHDRRLALGMTAYVLLPARVDAMSAIDVRAITKKFGDFTAVNGISFQVERGEVFGLLGPNGAGKSTLIRMMTTLVIPTSGTAIVDGADIVKDPNAVRHAIGVIPQAMTSDLELSARENLLIFAKLYSVPKEKREKLIPELLAAVELTAWADKPVKTLSGGMRRRVEIARGLVHEPRIFFLDEPTTGLDPVSRTAVWEMLRKIKADRDLTVLITTHYMDEADKLCDRIAIVDHGELKALDTPVNLKATVKTDSLDDVFVHFTGRDLRDATQDPSPADRLMYRR